MRLFWICLGGAAGTGARYLLSGWVQAALGTRLPYGTLAVNILGSFLLGAIMELSLATNLLAPALRLALTTGLLGGFTTYSAFNYETLGYFREGAWLYGYFNIGLTLVGCLVAGLAGLLAARVVMGG